MISLYSTSDSLSPLLKNFSLPISTTPYYWAARRAPAKRSFLAPRTAKGRPIPPVPTVPSTREGATMEVVPLATTSGKMGAGAERAIAKLMRTIAAKRVGFI